MEAHENNTETSKTEDSGSKNASETTKVDRSEEVAQIECQVDLPQFEQQLIVIKREEPSPDTPKISIIPEAAIKTEPEDSEFMGVINTLAETPQSSSKAKGKKKNRDPIIQRRKKIALSDDEWEPDEKKNTSMKGAAKGEEYYSYDILNQIEIVTISEEERIKELKEAYDSRKHMNYCCEKCAAGFVVKSAYDDHMKLHTKESGEYQCDVCEVYIKTEDTLHRHKLRHYRRYRCMICSQRYKDKDAVAGHVSFMHSGNTFDCDQCTSRFKRPQYLRRHIEQIHTKSTPMECPYCQQVYYESGWFRNHVRKHNKEVQDSKIVKCTKCDRTFKHKTNLKTHMLTHEPMADVACLECSETFNSIHNLEEHYKNAHPENFVVQPEEENKCTDCQRSFETKAKMHNHVLRMHVDGCKKYQCDHCKRLYYSKGELRSHIMWSHLHAGGHPCTCGRIFRTPVRLRNHIATRHLGAVPPKNKYCPHCDKAFSNQQVLTRHIKGHQGELFPCKECGRAFKTQSYVKVHYQVAHLNMSRAEIKRRNRRKLIMVDDGMSAKRNDTPTSEEELFGCTECDKKFKTQSYVKVHYYVKHLNMSRAEAKVKCKESKNWPPATKSIEEVFVKTEQAPLEIPMFETFVDIQHDSS